MVIKIPHDHAQLMRDFKLVSNGLLVHILVISKKRLYYLSIMLSK